MQITFNTNKIFQGLATAAVATATSAAAAAAAGLQETVASAAATDGYYGPAAAASPGSAMELALFGNGSVLSSSSSLSSLYDGGGEGGGRLVTSLDQLINNSKINPSSTITPLNNGSDQRSALERFNAAYQGVHGYLSVAVCTFGIISNVLNIIVLTRRHMRSPTNLLLTALAIADMFTMSTYPIFAIYWYILHSLSCHSDTPHPKSWVYFILFHNLFIQICHICAMWLTVALAVFRYIFVCRHQIAPVWCSMFRAKLTVALVTVAAVLVFTPHFFLYQVKNYNTTDPATGKVCAWWIDTSEFAKEHPVFDKFITSVFGVIMKISPCLLLAFLSGMLIIAMKRAETRRRRLLNNISRVIDSDGSCEHNRTTMMMVAVVLCFVITETPQGILALWAAAVTHFKHVYNQLGDLMDILVLINSAVNFILYCIMSKQFRDTFKSLFVAKHLPSFLHRLKNNKHQHANGNEYCSVKTETTHV